MANPPNNADNVSNYDLNLGKIRRRFKIRRQLETVFHKKGMMTIRDIIQAINTGKSGKSQVDINPPYKDPDPHNRGATQAAKTLRRKTVAESTMPLTLEAIELMDAIGDHLKFLNARGGREAVESFTQDFMSGTAVLPPTIVEAHMRLAKSSRYIDPKDSNTGDAAHKNPHPSAHKPKHLKIQKSRVKLEQHDYVEARQLLNLFLHDPNPFERERADAALEEALQNAANFFRQSQQGVTKTRLTHTQPNKLAHGGSEGSGLYHAFRGLAGALQKAKTDAAKAVAIGNKMKGMKKESAFTVGSTMTEAINQASSDKFLEAYARVRAYGQHLEERNGKRVMVEDAVHPMGHGYDTSSMTSTNPNGLNVGTSDNSKQKLTQPQLDDPHGVHWSTFFLDKGGGDSVEHDQEMMAQMFNYCAKKLGFNTVE